MMGIYLWMGFGVAWYGAFCCIYKVGVRMEDSTLLYMV